MNILKLSIPVKEKKSPECVIHDGLCLSPNNNTDIFYYGGVEEATAVTAHMRG